jgi:hypothetical protein
LLEYDAYSKLSVELHSFATKINSVINQTFENRQNQLVAEKSRDYLLFELIPRSSLFREDLIVKDLKSLGNQVRFIFDYNRLVVQQDSLTDNLDGQMSWSGSQIGWKTADWPQKRSHFYYTQNYLDRKDAFIADSAVISLLCDSLRNNCIKEYAYINEMMRIVDSSYKLKKVDTGIVWKSIRVSDKMHSYTNMDADIIPRVIKNFEQNISRFDSLIIASNEFAK